jgi:hypothetical protein
VKPPGHDVSIAWAWKPAAGEFFPDLMVHPATSENVRVAAHVDPDQVISVSLGEVSLAVDLTSLLG